MKRPSRPTQHDVARAAGVSTAVVSLVINGRANGKIKIAEATQARVWDAIREQGYVPNLAARQLAGGHTNVIGVFTYESMFPMQPNSFYQPFLIGIEEEAESSGYNLLLLTRTSADGRRRIYHDGVNRLQAAEGAILLGTNEDRSELGRLSREGYPFVFIGRREIEGKPLAYTAADYTGGTSALIQQLLDLGHRRMLYLGHPPYSESAIDRERGFLATLSAAGFHHPEQYIRRFDLETIDEAGLRSLLTDGVTALAVEPMPAALQILNLAKSIGLDVPHDFSLVALGKADDPTVDHHGIDTFYIPHREMGAQAVSLLARMITEPEADFPRQVTIPCPPAPGLTLGPPPPVDSPCGRR